MAILHCATCGKAYDPKWHTAMCPHAYITPRQQSAPRVKPHAG